MIQYNLEQLNREPQSSLNEECGVFGVYNHPESSFLCYEGLLGLQHRGQEGAGIMSSNGQTLTGFKNEGLVADIFTDEILDQIEGKHAIGHVRYATQGGSGLMNVQPFLFYHSTGDFALCHNGNLINAKELRTDFELSGSLFQSTSDSEIIAHFIKQHSTKNLHEHICDALIHLDGAFAYLIMTKSSMYAARDKYGLRPLSMGKIGDSIVFASETDAFAAVGATFVRHVLPGEVIKVSKDGIESRFYTNDLPSKSLCSLEFIYFARPDSVIDGESVYQMRKRCGELLFKQADIAADLVMGIPESSLPAALGYASASGLPFEYGFVKNRFSSRTFIQPTQQLRERGVKMKLAPIRSVVEGKRIVIVDDSIVRGTTSRYLVNILREMGAKEIHMMIASPPLVAPCFYGVDLPSYRDLIAANHTVEEIKDLLGLDSLTYLSINHLLEAAHYMGMCLAYFNHEYPTELYSFKDEVNRII